MTIRYDYDKIKATSNLALMPTEKSNSLSPEKIIEKVLLYLPTFDKERFLNAYEFAKEAHKGQERKDGSSYITHPLQAANILADLRADEDTLIASLLHDVPEDTEKTIEDIFKHFGKNVAFLVDGITKLSKVYYRHDMAERQVESLKKLLIHSAKDPRVILIKLADRLHNMRTLQYVREDKRQRIAKETMEIYVPISNLFGIKELKNELEDLCFYYLYPVEYKKILQKVEKSKIKLGNILIETIKILEEGLKKNHIKATVYGRHRNLFTIFKRLKASSGNIADIKDVVAIRIIVSHTPQCYKALGVVHGFFKPKPNLFKDYIAVPKSNGYQSLHTTVFGLTGVSTELQIRSERMHKEAEYGILSRYLAARRGKALKLDKDRRSKWVEQILDIQKAEHDNGEFIDTLKQDIFEDRIFVFTPKGGSIDLPKGATCIDFAYVIHTDVGNKAVEAEVNGKTQPMTSVLKTGDTVKIIISKSCPGPGPDWLNFAKTNAAKNRIRDFLAKESRGNKVQMGKEILQKEFDRAGLGDVSGMNFKKVQKVMRVSLKKFFETLQDLLSAIGDGTLKPIHVVEILLGASRLPFKFYSFTKTGSAKTNRPARVGIEIICDDRIGLIRDITSIMSRFAMNIITFKTSYSRLLKAEIITIYFDVDSFDKLSELLRHIEQVDSVRAIVRIFVSRQILFLFVSAITVLTWILHPFLMKYFLHSEILTHRILHSVIVYFGFLFLFITILILKNLSKRSFPQFRESSLLWIIPAGIFILAVSVITAETYLLNLYSKDWPIILLLMISVFVYLFTEYYNYSRERKGLDK